MTETNEHKILNVEYNSNQTTITREVQSHFNLELENFATIFGNNFVTTDLLWNDELKQVNAL